MLNTVNKLKDILKAQITKGNTLYYIEEIENDKLTNLLSRSFPRTPFINIEVTSVDTENVLNNKINQTMQVDLQILIKSTHNSNIQVGYDTKKKVGYLKIADDVRTVLNNNTQVSGYWTELTITGGSQLEVNADDDVVQGWTMNLEILKKCI